MADAVEKRFPEIEKMIKAVSEKMIDGGRIILYRSRNQRPFGNISMQVNASQLMAFRRLVIGVIAGGEKAIIDAIENAEDDTEQGWKDLQAISQIRMQMW